jgi:hypothetical protein
VWIQLVRRHRTGHVPRLYVGLEEIDDGIWNVYFGPLKLGRLHERRMRIEDEYGRLYRHRDV